MLEGAAASAWSQARARASMVVRAMKHRRITAVKSIRGEVWAQINHAVVWRKRWAIMTQEQKSRFASQGYMPQLAGKGRVSPWIPSVEFPQPPLEQTIPISRARGENAQLNLDIAACADYIEQHMAERIEWDSSTEAGRRKILEYQQTVFFRYLC